MACASLYKKREKVLITICSASSDADEHLDIFLSEPFGIDKEFPEESTKAAIFKVGINSIHNNKHKYFLGYSEVIDGGSYFYAVPITDTKYM
ncbi:hypothetical protein RMATCC62417_16225 [Rhizopus microsporus]|nr:hypothetical protein RMATCC62417_16225 [Rhizopus microsporus]